MRISTDTERLTIEHLIEPSPGIADGIMAELTADEYVVPDVHSIPLVTQESGSGLTHTEFEVVAHVLSQASKPPLRYGENIYEFGEPEWGALVVPVTSRVLRLAINQAAQAAHLDGNLHAFELPLYTTLASRPEGAELPVFGVNSAEPWKDLEPYNHKPWLMVE